MKTKLFLLLLVLCLALTGCSFPASSGVSSTTASISTSATEDAAADLANALEQALAQDTAGKSFSSATEWLLYYGLDGFTQGKMEAVEQIYQMYFIREVPEAQTVAKSMLEWVIEGLRQEVLDHTDIDKLTDYLISAYLVAVGDKYATYLNEEDYKSYQSDTSGNFVGVGVSATYDMIANTLEVISVIAGSPAEAAGLQAGDFITHVDGTPIEELGYYASINNIRGEEGTTVVLTIRRGESSFDVSIVRAALTEQTVYHRIIGEGETKLGYLQITTFSEVTTEQFKAAVDELQAAGVVGLVFDMRNNGGGLLSTVLAMLDYLLPDGEPIANYVYYDGSKKHDVGSDKHHVNLPFAVITNAYTASAAELFSSALQDYAKKGYIPQAQVIGDVTYGKGTMQSIIEFVDGTAMTISIAYYQPPFSENYEGKGVIPDVSVSLPEEHQGKNPQAIPDAEDTQLQAALSTFGTNETK